MSLKFVAACTALFCAKPFASYAQGAPKGGCIDPAAFRRQQTVGQQPPAYRIYLTLGGLCEIQHRFTEAEQYYQSAYTLAMSVFGERRDRVVNALFGIGTTRLHQGRIRQADASFHQVLSILESDNNANPLDIAAVLNNLAVVQQMSGNFSKAAALVRKVVHIVETNPAADAVELGVALSNLATMLRLVGNRPEAVAAAERAGSILECCKNTDYFAANLAIRGLLRLDEGDLAGAETMLLRALSTMEGPSKQGSPAQAIILTDLAVFYARNGRQRDAEPYFQRALEINRRLLAPDHPRLLESMSAYAALLRATRRKSEAKRLEAYVDEQRKTYHAENPAPANVVDVHSLMRQSSH
jgi:tetratricopeptide (TPR) repeat protein